MNHTAIDAQARELEQTIAKNTAEILQAGIPSRSKA